jgi:hypothetical protein
MSLNSLFRRLMTRSLFSRQNVPSRRNARFLGRRIEVLEDRITPNAYTVDIPGDSSGSDSGSGSGLTGDLRWCIDHAIADGQTGTIGFSPFVFGSPQTITLSSSLSTDPNDANEYGPTAFVVSGSANITITGPSAGVTIDGGGNLRLFAVTNGATLDLQDLTLSGGEAQGGNGASATGTAGGGAAGLGGAVFDQGTLVIQSSTLTGNTAVGGTGGDGNPGFVVGTGGGGGGLGGNGTTNGAGGAPNGGTFPAGNGGFGGGGAPGNTGGSAGNGGFGGGGGGFAVGDGPGGNGGFGGGGTYTGNGGFGGGNENSSEGGGGGGAGLGGAIFSDGGSVTLINSTLTGNSATGGGGGTAYSVQAGSGEGLGGAVFSRNGTVNATFDTFSGNTAQGGTDIYILSDASDGGNDTDTGSGTASAELIDDILGQTSNSVTDFVSNTNAGGSAPTFTGSSNDLVRSGGGALGAAVISTADPMLGALASNGGPTQTMALLAGSPAISAGVTVGGITTDQRGDLRASPPDLGGYELTPAYTLTATVDGSNNLTVTDTAGDDNNMTAVISGGNLVLTDTLQIFQTPTIAGATLSNNNNTETIPLSSLNTSPGAAFTINLAGGNNKLTVDYTGGAFPDQIVYNGGANAGDLDGLSVKGNGAQSVTYTPSGTTPGNGAITSTSGSVSFSGLTPIDIFGMANATISFPSANDVVNVANGFDYLHGGTIPSLDVTGTSGGTAFENAAFWNDTSMTIDTTPVPGTDTVTINSANNANNITNFTVTEPIGSGGTIAVNGVTTFPGSVTLTGGSISQTGAITANNLTTSTAQGTTLGASNAVNTFNATNTLTGGITLNDVASTLTITGISEAGIGNVGVTNGGAINLTGNVTSGSGGVNLSAVTGYSVFLARSTGQVNTLSDADTLLATPSLWAATFTATPQVINYLGQGSVGHNFPTSPQNNPNPAPFPGDTIGGNVPYFAVQATAEVVIPSAGTWTFGVNSDDGFGLTVGSTSFSFPNPRGPGDTTDAITFPSAGVYPLNLVYFEQGGGYEVELYAAPGNFGGFTTVNPFELVGDTTDGGLSVGAGVGSITESGGIVSTTGTLTTDSSAGTTLNGANTVGTFNGTNSSGNLSLNNTANNFVISGISEAGGTTTVHNTGSTTINGTGIASTGNIVLTTTANLTVSSAVASSGGSTSLSFGSNNTGDTANINAAVTGSSATLTGGTGNDTITVTRMGTTNLTVNGGGGTDHVNVNSGKTAGDPGTAGTGAVFLTDPVGHAETYIAGVSGVGNDTIDVNDQNQVATSPPNAPNGAPVAGVPAITTGSGPSAVAVNGVDVLNYSGTAHLTTLNLVETTGTNTYNIQYPNSSVVGSVLPPTTNIQTSTITDTANLYGTTAGGSTFNMGFTTAGTTTTSLGSNSVTYPQGPDYLKTLNVYGRDKTTGDTFDVYPDANTLVNIDAGLPSGGSGDTLILNSVGLTNPAIVPLFGSTALPNGEIISGNKATLTWNSIETFPVPLGLGGTFDFQPVGSTTQPGYLPVYSTDTPTSGQYAAAKDGWLNPGAGSFDRSSPLKQPANSPDLSALLTTGEWGYAGTAPSTNDGKFQVSVAPNQDVQVTTYIGDYLPRRNINVYVGTPSNPYETLLNPSTTTFTTSNEPYQFVSYSGVFNPGSSSLMVITFNTPAAQQYWTVEGLDVRPLGLIAPLTISRVDAAPPTQAQLADGLTVDQYTGKGAAPFSELTICPQYGTPLNGSGQAVDFDPAVKGFQVQADANGNFTFDILRPTGDGASTISVTAVTGWSGTGNLGATGTGGLSVSPNPWVLPNPYIQQYTLPVVRRIDFGPLGTPGASDSDPNNPNYLVFGNAAYTSTAKNALGWIGTAPTPYDRGSSYNNLQRDGVFGANAPGDFELDMPAPNTTYSVTVLLGDAKYAESGMSIKVVNPGTLAVETTVVSGVNTPAGQSTSFTFPVTTDALGRIRLRFNSSASTDYWTLQDIEVRPEVGTATPPTGTQVSLAVNATQYAGTSTGTGVAYTATALPGTVPADGMTVTTYNITGAVPNSLLTITTSQGILDTADAGPTYTGIQVLASNMGTASFSITSPRNVNATSATITVTAVTGGSLGVFTQNYSGFNPAAMDRFDFTYKGSPAQAGFISVPNTTVYTPTTGYGWTSAVSGYDRGAGSAGGTTDNLFRAGAWGQGSATFEVSVAVGSTDDVRVYVGDPYAAWSGITVRLDGGAPVSVDPKIDRFGFVTLEATDTGDTGIMDVTISGGTWVAAGMDVATAGNLPTPATGLANALSGVQRDEFATPAIAGFNAVSNTATYTPATGYGWESAVSSFVRPASEFPAGSPLTATEKQFYGSGAWGQSPATFEIAVPLNQPSATYSVRIYLADPYNTWPGITVTGEGGVKQTISSSVSPPAYITLTGLQDVNGDGIITVTISGSLWVANGLDVVQGGSGNLPPIV